MVVSVVVSIGMKSGEDGSRHRPGNPQACASSGAWMSRSLMTTIWDWVQGAVSTGIGSTSAGRKAFSGAFFMLKMHYRKRLFRPLTHIDAISG
jgi:hypothetical protein